MRLRTARTRTTAFVAGMLGAALVIAGCTSDASGEDGTAAPSTSSVDGAFPVTIDTAYGEVTVEEKPQKIVVFTSSYLDLLDILGEEPIAWSNNESYDEFLGWYPWLDGVYEDKATEGLETAEGAPSAEAVAALDPDLILTDIWNVDEPLYDQLSQIAPTYVGIETDTQTSWQDNLTALAQLTGNDPAIVEQTEARIDDSVAAAADRLPGLQGATFQVPVFSGTPPQLWLTEFANALLSGIGLVPGDEQPKDGEINADVPPISLENIERLTADVLIVAASGSLSQEAIDQAYTALKTDPRLPELPASRNGAVIYLNSAEWIAINGGTPASYLWWLDRVVPQLEESTLNQSGR